MNMAVPWSESPRNVGHSSKCLLVSGIFVQDAKIASAVVCFALLRFSYSEKRFHPAVRTLPRSDLPSPRLSRRVIKQRRKPFYQLVWRIVFLDRKTDILEREKKDFRRDANPPELPRTCSPSVWKPKQWLAREKQPIDGQCPFHLAWVVAANPKCPRVCFRCPRFYFRCRRPAISAQRRPGSCRNRHRRSLRRSVLRQKYARRRYVRRHHRRFFQSSLIAVGASAI